MRPLGKHVTPEPADAIRLIRFQTLKLCQLIGDSCTKNGRITSAMSSIQSGARIAIEELEFAMQGPPKDSRDN